MHLGAAIAQEIIPTSSSLFGSDISLIQTMNIIKYVSFILALCVYINPFFCLLHLV